MDTNTIKELLKNFLDDDGKLYQYPSKHRYKNLALLYLASKFEPNKRYTEKQVNELLKMWHTFNDFFMLRRDLCDRHILGRERNGSFYWLEENRPTLHDLGIEL